MKFNRKRPRVLPFFGSKWILWGVAIMIVTSYLIFSEYRFARPYKKIFGKKPHTATHRNPGEPASAALRSMGELPLEEMTSVSSLVREIASGSH